MTLTLRHTAIALASVLAVACTASSDDPDYKTADPVRVGDFPDIGTDGRDEPFGVTECPQDRWMDIDDFPEESLSSETDLGKWLSENAKRRDVDVTESGLQTIVVRQGLEDGASPSGSDVITAHYYGYFPDGRRFDDSYSRGEPLVLPNDAVISGWTEALRDMKVCEARIVYIPGDLAYGARGRPGIPANATLIFKMQLLGVDK